MADAHDVASEDLIKRGTWDLPVDINPFLDVIHRPGIDGGVRRSVALFMELPAARTMPRPLKRQLILEGFLTKEGKPMSE